MYFCTEDYSISLETVNANASVFKFFLNVALNARSLCISVLMIILNLLKQNAYASAFKFFLIVALNARSICISVQMSILNLLKQRTQTPVRLNSFETLL